MNWIHLIAFYTECVNPAASLSHCCSLSLKINFTCDWSSLNWSVSHLWSMETYHCIRQFPTETQPVKGHRHWQTRDKLPLHSNTRPFLMHHCPPLSQPLCANCFLAQDLQIPRLQVSAHSPQGLIFIPSWALPILMGLSITQEWTISNTGRFQKDLNTKLDYFSTLKPKYIKTTIFVGQKQFHKLEPTIPTLGRSHCRSTFTHWTRKPIMLRPPAYNCGTGTAVKSH